LTKRSAIAIELDEYLESMGPPGLFIQAAAKLFYEKGYVGTTIEEISARAGFTKGAFYYYFESKADLLRRIHDLFISKALDDAERIMAGNASPDQKLCMLIDSLIKCIDAYLPYVTVFFNEFHHLEEPNRSEITRKRDRYFSIFLQAMTQSVEEDLYRKDIDPRIAVFGLFGMCNWMHKWYHPGGPWTSSDISRNFIEIFRKGMLNRPIAMGFVGQAPEDSNKT